MCDRLFGTFRPYRGLDDPEPAPEPPKQWWENLKDPACPEEDEPKDQVLGPMGRPACLPSPWSFAWVTVSMVFATCLVEWTTAEAMPDPHDYAIFTKAVIVVANVAFLCHAVEVAFRMPVEIKGKSKKEYVKPRMRDVATRSKYKEAVPPGHVKSMLGSKQVYKPTLREAIKPSEFKRD